MKRGKVKELVLQTLKENEKTRKDDFLLVYEVILKITNKEFITFKELSIDHVYFGIPSYGSITRARRNLQKKYPELKDKKTAEIREIEELKYYEEFRRR